MNLYEREILKKIEQDRQNKIIELSEDPYLGFKDLDQAFEECKITSQAEVLARLLNRENLFISGMAGAGKTAVINRFIELIDAEYKGVFNIAVTASTGIAATLISGSTIHSWAGFGVSKEPFDPSDLDYFIKSKRKQFEQLDVLIIDEISMLPAYLFTKLNAALKYFRKNDEPFGGVQLVVIGDFLQLPPVNRKSDVDVDNRFVIETDDWKEADFKFCFLDKTYRATDERLKKILIEISKNSLSTESEELINERMFTKPDSGKAYTTLFTTNKNVDKYNEEQLSLNPNPSRKYIARNFGAAKEVEKAYKKYNIPETIELKVGATVILTKNLKQPVALANGSIGVVQKILTEGVQVKFNNGHTEFINYRDNNITKKEEFLVNGKMQKIDVIVATVSQIPLKLGYAITVHKSQGQTFDGVVMDLSNCFQEGLGYVALSRVRSIDDLVIQGINKKAYKVSAKSQKITLYVKKKAFLDRRVFLENKDYYDSLLTDSFARLMNWHVEEASARL